MHFRENTKNVSITPVHGNLKDLEQRTVGIGNPPLATSKHLSDTNFFAAMSGITVINSNDIKNVSKHQVVVTIPLPNSLSKLGYN